MIRHRRSTASPLLTAEARAIPIGGFEHARRLGHPYVGCEHWLLALAGAGHPAAAALREHGVTPDRVEEQVVRLAGGGLFGDLDRNALAAVGIDVDAVRDRLAESLGQQALSQAGHAAQPRDPDVPWWDPRRRSVAGMHVHGVYLPGGPGMGQCFRNMRAEAQARHDPQIGVEHLALGLLSVTEGLLPGVLAALGVTAAELRTAVTGRVAGGETGEPPRA